MIGGSVRRLFGFVPAVAALLAAAAIMGFGPHDPATRVVAMVGVFVAIWLARKAALRHPLKEGEGLSSPWLMVILAVIFMVTLLAIVFVPLVTGFGARPW